MDSLFSHSLKAYILARSVIDLCIQYAHVWYDHVNSVTLHDIRHTLAFW